MTEQKKLNMKVRRYVHEYVNIVLFEPSCLPPDNIYKMDNIYKKSMIDEGDTECCPQGHGTGNILLFVYVTKKQMYVEI
jgi:hypothetical protein